MLVPSPTQVSEKKFHSLRVVKVLAPHFEAVRLYTLEPVPYGTFCPAQ